jgi:hypothetical protein
MRRLLTASLMMLMIVILMVAPAMAANPHFIFANAAIDGSGNLVVSWKEAGLGNNQNIIYEAGATQATATYACINGGGKNPSAANKRDESGPVSETGTFSSGRNGQITASLTVAPPASTLECPPGQRHVLAAVSYSGIYVQDTTNDIRADVPGTLSKVLVQLKN